MAASLRRLAAIGCRVCIGLFFGLPAVVTWLVDEEFREPRYAPPPLLKRMVLAGWLGKKSGRGFYDYATSPPAVSELGL